MEGSDGIMLPEPCRVTAADRPSDGTGTIGEPFGRDKIASGGSK